MSEAYSSADVTVVIPAHNCERYIVEALQSIESQAVRPGHVIVVENASTDGTLECIEGFTERSDLSVRLVHTDCPGVSNARNLGFSLAETRLIAMLDADDLYESDFLKQALQAYNAIDTLALFFGNRKPLKNGSVLDEPFLEKTRLKNVPSKEIAPAIHKVSEGLFEALVYGNFVSCSGAVVRREAAYAAELFPTFLSASEDRYFFTKLALQGPAAFTLETTHLYRTHDASRTGNSIWLDLKRNALLCLQALLLESGQNALDRNQRSSLELAHEQAQNDFFYTASENGLESFKAAKLWARRSGIRSMKNPLYWLKAMKNNTF